MGEIPELEITDVHSADIQDKIETWQSKDSANLYIGIELIIGKKQKEPAALQQCVLASPKRLSCYFMWEYER